MKYMTDIKKNLSCVYFLIPRKVSQETGRKKQDYLPTSGEPDADVVSDKSDWYPIGYEYIPQSISLLLIM